MARLLRIYGFTHYIAVLLGCNDGDGNLFVVDEHAARPWVPQRHAEAIHALFARYGLALLTPEPPRQPHVEKTANALPNLFGMPSHQTGRCR